MAAPAAVYNKSRNTGRKNVTAMAAVCITKVVAVLGRPTDDPKGKLVAVRLSARQVQALEQRSRREDTGLSEAVRRCVDDWAAAQPAQPKSAPRSKQAAVKPPAVASRKRPTPHRKARSAK